MTTMRRKLRLRLRFGLGLAAAIAALVVLTPSAYAAKPKPPAKPKQGSSAAAQYTQPAAITYVTTRAVKVGKCKLAVQKRFVPKVKVCKKHKTCLKVAKAKAAAIKKCNNIGKPVKKTQPAAKKPAAKKTATVTFPTG